MASLISMRVVNANKVVLQLDKYEKDLNQKALMLCDKLAGEAWRTADAEYNGYEAYDPEDWVVVEKEEIMQGFWQRGYRIVAYGNEEESADGTMIGNTVMFAEFGSGTMAGDHPMANQFNAHPDAFSPHNYKEFHELGYWIHNGKRYTAVRPTMAMFKAGLKARSKVYEFAKRIFRGGES